MTGKLVAGGDALSGSTARGQPVPAEVVGVSRGGSVTLRTEAGEATVQLSGRTPPAGLRPGAQVFVQIGPNGEAAVTVRPGAVPPPSAASTAAPTVGTASPAAASGAGVPTSPLPPLPPLQPGQTASAIVVRPTSLPSGVAATAPTGTAQGSAAAAVAQAAARYVLSAQAQISQPSRSMPNVLLAAAPTQAAAAAGGPASVQASGPPIAAGTSVAPSPGPATPMPTAMPPQGGTGPRIQATSPSPISAGAAAPARSPTPTSAPAPGAAPGPSPTPQGAAPASASQSAVPSQAIPAAPSAVQASAAAAPSATAGSGSAFISVPAASRPVAPGPAASPGQTGQIGQIDQTAPTGQIGQTASTGQAVTAPPASSVQVPGSSPQPTSRMAPPLPPGTEFAVRVLSVSPPPAGAGGPSPAASVSAGGGPIIAGTVVGSGANGQAIVSSSVGLLDLAAEAAPEQLRAEVRLEMLNRATADGARASGREGPTPLPILARSWPALDEVLQALAATAPTGAAKLPPSVPRPGPQLASAILFFMSALRGGDIGNWLGDDTARLIDRLRGQAAAGLRDDFRAMERAAEPSESGWRAFFVPILDGDNLDQMRFFVHPDAKKQGDEDEDSQNGTRFVVDLTLTRIGPFQIDGLAKRSDISLLVRTHHALPQRMRADILEIFTGTLARTGVTGALTFRVETEFPPLPVIADGKAGSGPAIVA